MTAAALKVALRTTTRTTRVTRTVLITTIFVGERGGIPRSAMMCASEAWHGRWSSTLSRGRGRGVVLTNSCSAMSSSTLKSENDRNRGCGIHSLGSRSSSSRSESSRRDPLNKKRFEFYNVTTVAPAAAVSAAGRVEDYYDDYDELDELDDPWKEGSEDFDDEEGGIVLGPKKPTPGTKKSKKSPPKRGSSLTSPNSSPTDGVRAFSSSSSSSSVGISREDDLPKPGEDEDSSPPRPLEKSDVEISFSRSGGAGGQNVNKVNTKVDMRLSLGGAVASGFLPKWVAARLRILEKNRINSEDCLVVNSTKHRTQSKNIDDALEKMDDIIQSASVLKDVENAQARKKMEKSAKRANAKRLEQKKSASQKKKLRSGKGFD